MLHFDAYPIEIEYLVTDEFEGFVNAKNNIKQKNLNSFANIGLISLDHVTYLYYLHIIE